MDISTYVQSGYGSLMIETSEIKRAINSITCNGSFNTLHWNITEGSLIGKEYKKMDPDTLILYCSKLTRTVVIAENFEQFIGDVTTCQNFLNQYGTFKSNQVCFVIVGCSSKNIPVILKSCIAILDFNLPGKAEIQKTAEALSGQFKKALDDAKKSGAINDAIYKNADYSVTQEVVESCLSLSMEELENALAYSARSEYRFNPSLIIERKRAMLRNTGFMDFMVPEPIENLGGMDEFKAYIEKRLEPFQNPNSIKPKLRSILLVGVQGCLSGDTQILIKRGDRKTGRTYSIEEAYYRFNNIRRKGIGTGNNQWWDQSIDTYAHCHIGGNSLGWNLVNNIIYSGVKFTHQITTETGKQIRATDNHPFKVADDISSDNGYLSLNTGLRVGIPVICKDDHVIRGHLGRSCGRKIVYSIPFHPFAHKNIVNGFNYKRLPFSRLVYEAHLNQVSVNEFIKCLRDSPARCEKFIYLLPDIAIHHKDRDVCNDDILNLEAMTRERHDELHRIEFHSHGVYKNTIPEKIIRITPFGMESVYDIQMDAPHHNFVANNFVVHNCGKSLATKVLCSMFNWNGIVFDIGATKDKYVGGTGERIRMGTKIVDAVGRCIVQLDEIEKGVEQTEFGGGKQSGGGAVADMIGHMLTWMQERKSEAIVVATSNNLNALPPEFLRAGRWDRIFFVGLPNPYEIQSVIKIMNRKHKSELPIDLEFCKSLWKERWSPAEIEQLAKDSHYDDIAVCMKNIPILAQYKEKEINKIVEDGKKYSPASIEFTETQTTKRKVMVH